MKVRNLIGQSFGEWTVVDKAEDGAGYKARWVCRCSCGTERAVFETHLIRGRSKSCGKTHGKLPKSTPGYTSWDAMRDRCSRASHPAYHRYGGRGIKVCERWKDFANFYADMGPRPDGMSLERIDRDGNYEPSNCKWATPKEQQNNTCTNRFIEDDGELLTIAQVARKHGLLYRTLYSRLQRRGAI